MPNEPMFNIEERAPLWLSGVLIVLFVLMSYGPPWLANLMQQAGLLVPLQLEQVPPWHHVTSSLGSGFLHASWSHVLVNSGMIVAFAVLTLRGVRALAIDNNKPAHANRVFMVIFLAGVAGGSLFQWGWWAAIDTTSAAALGASGGASALFATAAWAMGGRDRLIKFGMGWALLNAIFVVGASILGGIAWAAHAGGFIVGAMLAPYLVKPFSTGFSITR